MLRASVLGTLALIVTWGVAALVAPTYVRFLRYFIRHKFFVFLYCCTLGVWWRGITHDLSKLRPSEFGPYARFFFGVHDDLTRRAFEHAWHWHYARNRHHWEHWVLTRNGRSGISARAIGTFAVSGQPIGVETMDDASMREMLANWLARTATQRDGGDAFENTRQFYLTHRDELILAADVRAFVEQELAIPLVRETGWRPAAVVLDSQLHPGVALHKNDPVVAPGGRRGVFLGYQRGKALVRLLHTDQLIQCNEKDLHRV